MPDMLILSDAAPLTAAFAISTTALKSVLIGRRGVCHFCARAKNSGCTCVLALHRPHCSNGCTTMSAEALRAGLAFFARHGLLQENAGQRTRDLFKPFIPPWSNHVCIHPL